METRSREVALRLVQRGHEVTYLCAKTLASDPDREVRQGISIVRKKVLPDAILKRFPFPHYFPLAAANAFLMFYLPAFLKKGRFDYVREEISPVPISGLLSFFPFRKTERVAIVHGLPGEWKKWVKLYGLLYGNYGALMEGLLRRGWMRYRSVIVPAKWYADELRRHRPLAGRIAHIPNGVNKRSFDVAKRPPHRSSGAWKVVSIGRLATNKGHRYLLEALAILKKKGLHVEGTILGRGLLEKSLKELIQSEGLEDRVRILDFLPEKEMPRFYGSFDQLVMPSLLEGFNLVLLEAIASGLPVLASDIPGFKDIVGEKEATFFKSGDSQSLAAQIEWSMAHSEDLRFKAEKARERIQVHDWEEASDNEMKVLSCQWS